MGCSVGTTHWAASLLQLRDPPCYKGTTPPWTDGAYRRQLTRGARETLVCGILVRQLLNRVDMADTNVHSSAEEDTPAAAHSSAEDGAPVAAPVCVSISPLLAHAGDDDALVQPLQLGTHPNPGASPSPNDPPAPLPLPQGTPPRSLFVRESSPLRATPTRPLHDPSIGHTLQEWAQ